MNDSRTCACVAWLRLRRGGGGSASLDNQALRQPRHAASKTRLSCFLRPAWPRISAGSLYPVSSLVDSGPLGPIDASGVSTQQRNLSCTRTRLQANIVRLQQSSRATYTQWHRPCQMHSIVRMIVFLAWTQAPRSLTSHQGPTLFWIGGNLGKPPDKHKPVHFDFWCR